MLNAARAEASTSAAAANRAAEEHADVCDRMAGAVEAAEAAADKAEAALAEVQTAQVITECLMLRSDFLAAAADEA